MTNIEKRLKLSSNEIIKGNISNTFDIQQIRNSTENIDQFSIWSFAV